MTEFDLTQLLNAIVDRPSTMQADNVTSLEEKRRELKATTAPSIVPPEPMSLDELHVVFRKWFGCR